MSERFSDSDPQAPIRAEIAEFSKERIGWIESTAFKIGGEGATIDTVFKLPPAVRDTAPVPDWDEKQEAAARELGHKLGYAAEHDVVSELKGIDFAEGGKVWKIWAEVEAAAGNTLVVSGSPHRPIGEDEKDFLVTRFASRLGEDITDEEKKVQVADYHKSLEGYTEYDAAADIAAELVATEPFADIRTVPNPNRSTLSYGYEVSEGNPVVNRPTGQFVREGTNSKGQEIVLMCIDRENYIDPETQEQKYRFQPNPLRRMGIIADVYSQQGDTETPIVFVTSNAYASRQIDVIQAGLTNGRQYGVTIYGRSTLARVKDEPMLPGARLNQLPGDIRIMYENLQQLRAEVTS
jgi:hypothetical protein